MVAQTYDAAMVRVYADEGGYGLDPVDPGGATTYGITIIDARKYAEEFGWIVGRQVTVNDMKVMPKSFAAKVYQRHYAAPMRYDDLPAGFDYSVLDAAINSGVGRAPVWAGKALGIPAKSINDVVAPANAAPDKVVAIQKYWAVRLSFLQGLGTFWRFGTGWTRRCTTGEAAAVRMWLSVGAKLPAADAKAKLNAEAAKAKDSAKTASKAAAGSGGGPAVAAPSLDWGSIPLSGKIALGLVFAFLIGTAIYFIRQAIIHNQRAAAYAVA